MKKLIYLLSIVLFCGNLAMAQGILTPPSQQGKTPKKPETTTPSPAPQNQNVKPSPSQSGQSGTSKKTTKRKINVNVKPTAPDYKKVNRDFLEENRLEYDIYESPSGLQYRIIRSGNGKKPNYNDYVTVHYSGKLIDGSEFDSSYTRGEPSTFPLDKVIEGFSEGLQLMQEGAKYQLFIPAELAYGEQGAPPFIYPNSTVIFEVELIKVGDNQSNAPEAQTKATNANETINGITIHWPSDVTADQMNAIRNLVKNMVKIEGGEFYMGSNSTDAFLDEQPMLRQNVSTFYLDKYEVTQNLWKAVMGNNPSEFKGGNNPVEMVSINDCLEFIKKLNHLTDLNFRLPTETEWEYAARGGNSSRGYKFSGSDNIENVAWYDDNSGRRTHPVGTKSPNELGLYDMTGNVDEWTSDKYSSDYASPRNLLGDVYVNRGGGCFSGPKFSRVTARSNYSGTRTDNHVGFRLALDY